MTNTITKNTIINDIINFFKNNTDLFNDCIEQLDGYNGYLNDDRYYDMYDIDELLTGKTATEILNMAFFGGDEFGGSFNPNSDYFKFNAYGNLISSDHIDYSYYIDEYAIISMMENRQYIDSIDWDERLAKLFDQLEELTA